MKDQTKRVLGEINRRFYEDRAESFSATRQYPWSGWERLLSTVRDQDIDSTQMRVLDAGCGNGRFFRFLNQSDIKIVRYVGMDENESLLNEAMNEFVGNEQGEWIGQNIIESDWRLGVDEKFDLVVCLGVMHHIPGFDSRVELIERMSQLLSDSGLLVISLWQYQTDPRFESKLVGWDQYNLEVELGYRVEIDDLESGDVLLDWKGDSSLARYVHVFGDEEVTHLVDSLKGLKVVDEYQADGKSGSLNRYLVFVRA